MEAQEIFNKVVTHLRAQKCKSLSDDGYRCRYRNSIGQKCAIGCLIPDEIYSPDMEGYNVKNLIIHNDEFHAMFGKHELFLSRLQAIHDNLDQCDWEVYFKVIAIEYGLTMPEAKE